MIRSSSPLTAARVHHADWRRGGVAARGKRAQQADKVYRIGYLGLASAAAQATRMKALRGGGWPRSCRALH
jgi:hypothetical protein